MIAEKLILCFVLFMSVIFDVTRHKIPNSLVLIGMSGGCFLLGRDFLLVFSLVVLLFIVLFLFRMIGGGDIKLLGVVSGFIGLKAVPLYIMLVFFIGGILSLLKFLICGGLKSRMSYLLAYFRRISGLQKKEAYYLAERDGYACTIPFSVPIAAGYLLYLLLKGG